jgi:molybdopterin-guanine dinucleotide biosynthesis protein A
MMRGAAVNNRHVDIRSTAAFKKMPGRQNLKDVGVTGVILAGGVSARMGADKALLTIGGRTFFEIMRDFMLGLFASVLIAGNRSDLARDDLPCYPDRYSGSALGGLYTGLLEADTEMIFVASCDMPFPDREIVRKLLISRHGYDVVVPKTPYGFEPLFALYRKSCLVNMKSMLEKGQHCIYSFYSEVSARYVGVGELPANWRHSLMNVNTPEQYRLIKEEYQ